jgi:hypothetical protein
MLSKIYYAFGISVMLLYTGAALISMNKKPPPEPTPKPISLRSMRIVKGKYVYVPPSTNNGGSSSRSGSSYPSSGGISGGK